MNRKVATTFATIGCLFGMQVMAQNQPVPVQNQQGRQGNQQGNQQFRQTGQQAQWQNADHELATCVAIANQEEIAVAKFAEEKTKNKEVKDFAQMLQHDHQAFLQKLQRYAPEATQAGYLMEQRSANEGQRTGAIQQNQPGQKQQAQAAQTRPGVQVGVQPAGGQVNVAVGGVQQTAGVQQQGQWHHLDFVALHRELAESCIQQAKEAMNKKDASKFDECFIGAQIVKHAEMKNKLTVLQRHVSPELKQIFADGLQTTESHMKKAEDIMKKLEDSRSSSSKSSS